MSDKTNNHYVGDNAELTIAISASNVANLATFTTAETIVLWGVLRKAEETTSQRRTHEETRVTGCPEAPITYSNKQLGKVVWTLTLVDDYFKGETGEWGTDGLTSWEIFNAFFTNLVNEDPGGITITPAGNLATHITHTLVNPKVVFVSRPGGDADATKINEYTVEIGADSTTQAVHG